MTDIHSCSYYCDRPECIKAQRDELRDRLAQPERHELQAKGEHPAPCARHCEATAFQIVIKNLKAQLAQQEQEEKMFLIDEDTLDLALEALHNVTEDYVENRQRTHNRAIEQLHKVFTQKPQRKPWVGLTDEEKAEIWSLHETAMVVTATEAKLKEKNT